MDRVKSLVPLIVALGMWPSLSPGLEVQGHRGARALRPENSLPAFEYAMNQGVDVLEMDLAVTKDNKLVISHDPRLNPEICLSPEGTKLFPITPIWIHELTLDEVKKYDCGSLRHRRFEKQVTMVAHPPSLDEVFDLVKKKKSPVRFNIETKSFRDIAKDDYPVTPAEFAKLWYEKVKQHGMLKRSVMQSFDYRTLIAAKGIDKEIKIAALSEDPHEDFIQTAKQLSAEIISPFWEMPNVNKSVVEQLHKIHVQIIPWTPDDPSAWEKLIRMGVDGLITDDPAALIQFLKTRKTH